jgi:hypothetical protein
MENDDIPEKLAEYINRPGRPNFPDHVVKSLANDPFIINSIRLIDKYETLIDRKCEFVLPKSVHIVHGID